MAAFHLTVLRQTLAITPDFPYLRPPKHKTITHHDNQPGRSIGERLAGVRQDELRESQPRDHRQGLRAVQVGADILLPFQAGPVQRRGGEVHLRHAGPGAEVQLRGRHAAGVHRPPRGRRGAHHAPHRGPAGRRQQPAGVQLQLLLLPPADASAAVLPRCPSEVRRTVRERPQAVARQHRAGEVGRRNPRGRGHGGSGRHVPRGVLRPVLRAGVPHRAGHGRTPPQAPLHLFTD